MTKDIIRVGHWTINLDQDILVSRETMMKFSSFKNKMLKEQPELVERHRLGSKLTNGEIVKHISWSEVVEEAIDMGII